SSQRCTPTCPATGGCLSTPCSAPRSPPRTCCTGCCRSASMRRSSARSPGPASPAPTSPPDRGQGERLPAASHPLRLVCSQLPLRFWPIAQLATLVLPDADADTMVTPSTLIAQVTLPPAFSCTLIE